MIRAGIDWGSSSFRAYRFNDAGQYQETVSDGPGIKFVDNAGFETVLREKIGDWLTPGDTVLLSGMITSRNGWLESPYIACPANLADIISGGLSHRTSGLNLIFLPGISQVDPPDVMRGEELQLLGSGAEGICVIPGTHSKWAEVSTGCVHRFRTIPTGELFDLLVNHALIGSLTEQGVWDSNAFTDGVERGFTTATVLSDLFVTRSSVLMQTRNPNTVRCWLSGLLIGSEIREGLCLTSQSAETIVLIGSTRLCEKYREAMEFLSLKTRIAPADVAMLGFQRIIGLNNEH